MNVQDILPALLRTRDPDELAEDEATAPTTLDYLANYRDGLANDRDGADVLEFPISKTLAGGGAGRLCGYDVGPSIDALESAAHLHCTMTPAKIISYPSNVLS